MTQIVAYLTFDGNCREAMNFYKDCLGGELSLNTVGDSAMAAKLPPGMKESIMHSSLVKGSLTLMASDMMDDSGLVRGNAISLMINCSSEAELTAFFNRLSVGGKINTAPKTEFWGSVYADLTDRFGTRWMLNFDKPKT